MSDNRIHAPAQSVPVQGLAFGNLGEEARPVHAAAPLPIYSPGGLLTVSASVQRPADTVTYAVGDLVANSTTTVSVVALEFTEAVRASGEAMRIERVRLRKSSAALSNASFRVHLFNKAPVATTGDNGIFSASGVLSLSEIDGYVGSVDVTLDTAAAVGARGGGVPATGSGMTCRGAGGTGHETSLWAMIEARAAYVPASAESFVVTLEGARG